MGEIEESGTIGEENFDATGEVIDGWKTNV
jgi:hypothetical protein